MNKSVIRKKILEIRKQNNFKKLKINFKSIFKVLKKENIKGKILGGYYPYNYEVDGIQILKKFEKQNYLISLPKIKKNSQMDFFYWSTKDPLVINKYGIDQLRYYLMKEVSHGSDGNISLENLEKCVNSDLANNYGNLCQRIFAFIKNNCNNVVSKNSNLS